MNIPDQSSVFKRVYLDVCALCRPFDDQYQLRIHLETSAVGLILSHVRQAEIGLIVSPVHELEISAIPDLEERGQLLLLLEELGTWGEFHMETARARAEQWIGRGMGPADAAHLSFAEEAGADFITVDDRLLRQCRQGSPVVWCGTPPAYCEKENLR
jgi:predicted nucleic acid-binding protein